MSNERQSELSTAYHDHVAPIGMTSYFRYRIMSNTHKYLDRFSLS